MESEGHIFVVEDDKYQRLRIEDIVTLLEYRVTIAVDGQGAQQTPGTSLKTQN